MVTMHALDLTKPDGRAVTLYGCREPRIAGAVPSPFTGPVSAQPHLRWHPLRGEWITYAAHRQNRTFLPPPDYDPLAVTVDERHPTELPAGEWDIAVFDNRFPSLVQNAVEHPSLIVPTAPGYGKCEVVVYTQERGTSLGTLSLTHIELLLSVWADRTERLRRDERIAYVLPFENRGVEVGATLHHPHGQIYAYPCVPPVPQRMLDTARTHFYDSGRGVLQEMIEREITADERLLYRGEHAVAFVPVCARYPYEAWVAPILPVQSFAALSNEQRADLARALKTVLMKYDGLWNKPFPYLMAWYQAPVDNRAYPHAHLHAEFYPPYRTRDKLKFLAGTELGAGFFAMDALPEDKARELQAVPVTLA